MRGLTHRAWRALPEDVRGALFLIATVGPIYVIIWPLLGHHA